MDKNNQQTKNQNIIYSNKIYFLSQTCQKKLIKIFLVIFLLFILLQIYKIFSVSIKDTSWYNKCTYDNQCLNIINQCGQYDSINKKYLPLYNLARMIPTFTSYTLICGFIDYTYDKLKVSRPPDDYSSRCINFICQSIYNEKFCDSEADCVNIYCICSECNQINKFNTINKRYLNWYNANFFCSPSAECKNCWNPGEIKCINHQCQSAVSYNEVINQCITDKCPIDPPGFNPTATQILFSPPTPFNADSNTMKTYTSKNLGILFKYPSGWEVEETIIEGFKKNTIFIRNKNNMYNSSLYIGGYGYTTPSAYFTNEWQLNSPPNKVNILGNNYNVLIYNDKTSEPQFKKYFFMFQINDIFFANISSIFTEKQNLEIISNILNSIKKI